MSKVIFTIKPPEMESIVGSVCKVNHLTIDWYYDNFNTYQPGIIRLKELIAYIAYSYGYTRKQIGVYLGSDSGSSVPYYYNKMDLCVKAYSRDREILSEIIELLKNSERYAISYEHDNVDPLYTLFENIGIWSRGSRVLTPTVKEIYVRDIKWKAKPLRDLPLDHERYKLEQIDTNLYKVILSTYERH